MYEIYKNSTCISAKIPKTLGQIGILLQIFTIFDVAVLKQNIYFDE